MDRGLIAAIALVVLVTAESSRPTQHRVVRIEHFEFQPSELTVAVGDTIEWRNADVFAHTSAADSGAWKSLEMAPDSVFVFVARDTGRFAYHCDAHPSMHAVLIVR